MSGTITRSPWSTRAHTTVVTTSTAQRSEFLGSDTVFSNLIREYSHIYFPTLTIAETLRCVADTQALHRHPGGATRAGFVDVMTVTNIVMANFGLQ